MTTPDVVSADSTIGIPEPVGLEDTITGLEGPELWRRLLGAEVSRSSRYRRPLTVVLLDVDGMADLLEVWGPEAARQILRDAALCLRRMSRASDHCARLGPARFGILLTETDEIAAINFVERVREDGPSSLSRSVGRVRFTFGWASPKFGEAPEAVMNRAEARIEMDRAD